MHSGCEGGGGDNNGGGGGGSSGDGGGGGAGVCHYATSWLSISWPMIYIVVPNERYWTVVHTRPYTTWHVDSTSGDITLHAAILDIDRHWTVCGKSCSKIRHFDLQELL